MTEISEAKRELLMWDVDGGVSANEYPAVNIQRALLWDVDGVLVDSEPLHVAKLKEVCKRHEIELKDKYMTHRQSFRIPVDGEMKAVQMQLGGAGDKNIYWWAYAEHLRNEGLPKESMPPSAYGFMSQQEWLDELLEFYMAHANNEKSRFKIKPRENMPEMVDALREEGTLQGVVTSGIPKQVETNLKVLGRDASGEERSAAFSFALDADSVKHSKPNPEGYKISVEQLSKLTDADALAIVSVEDSKPGVIAALKAGICCVHFLLPGQSAMTLQDFENAGINAHEIARYRVAATGKDAEKQARALFCSMEKGRLRPLPVQHRRGTYSTAFKTPGF